MICKSCGQELAEQVTTCVECGKQVDATKDKSAKIVKSKMRRPLYLGAFFLCFMVFFYLSVANTGDWFLQAMALFMIACAGLVIWTALYWGWEAIDDGNNRTTPGRTILYLLIPVFNFYWMFQAIGGFPKDYNLYLRRHQLSAPKLRAGWFITLCVLVLINFGLARSPEALAQLIGYLATMVVGAIVINKICKAINRLPPQALVAPGPEISRWPVPRLYSLKRSRFAKWTSIAATVLATTAVFVIIADRIQQNQRIREFKTRAQTTAEQLGPALAAAVTELDRSATKRPSRQLYETMKIADMPFSFTYAVLYLPDPSGEDYLRRYQGAYRSTKYENDPGIEKIPVENEIEREIRNALRGDNTVLNEINRNSRATMHVVIAGRHGKPLAVLRFVIPGRGGTERDIR